MFMVLCNKPTSEYDTETERQHFDYFVVTGCPWGGRVDHLKDSQWLQNSQRDYFSISVDPRVVMYPTIGIHPLQWRHN